MCYVLDEPSIGLHASDNDRLIESIRELQSQGNTIVVVEHDEAMMWAADQLIDMGPGAGWQGGRILSQGTPQQVADDPRSLTGQHLKLHQSGIEVPQRRSVNLNNHEPPTIRLIGAKTHNLKSLDVEFPLGRLIGVTGVSGSGKSSLVNDTLIPAVMSELNARPGSPGRNRSTTNALKSKSTKAAGKTKAKKKVADEEAESVSSLLANHADFEAIEGLAAIDKLIPIDQSPSVVGHAVAQPPTADCSTKFAKCSLPRAKPNNVGSRAIGLASMQPAVVATYAKVKVLNGSK